MMSPENLAQLANIALIPIAGLLWRISTQLAALVATMQAHDARIKAVEDRCERRGCSA